MGGREKGGRDGRKGRATGVSGGRREKMGWEKGEKGKERGRKEEGEKEKGEEGREREG